MADDFAGRIDEVVRRAPRDWLIALSEALKATAPETTLAAVVKRVPSTNNANLSFLIEELLKVAFNSVSWEAVGWSLRTASEIHERGWSENQVELLWSGPSPPIGTGARRIDQALYDLILGARRDILLITFAAFHVELLSRNLLTAIDNGVTVRMVLEFGETSEGQLSYDAIKAFPRKILEHARIYYWPIEQRERNQAGRPGKLHAKVAIIDETALISSANLTDDAFSRNLEIGALFKNRPMIASLMAHVGHLIASGMLTPWHRPDSW